MRLSIKWCYFSLFAAILVQPAIADENFLYSSSGGGGMSGLKITG